MKKSAFPAEGIWLKGNLHSHTTRTDGFRPPKEQIHDYREQGYDFLAITDHNVIDSHQLNEYSDFIMLPGWERDIPYSPFHCIHLIGLGEKPADQQEEYQVPRCKPEDSDQRLIDEMKGMNQFVFLAHPSWSRMGMEEVLKLEHLDAVEVFNTGCERLCHAGYGDLYWDMMLRQGRHVYGIACDDTHEHTKKSDRFGGWVMVRSAEKNFQSILDAIRKGNFYSTQGPQILDWGIEDGKAYLECSPCEEIHFVTYPKRGSANYAENGELLTGLTYQLNENVEYIRAECIDSQGRRAWTNPIFVKEF